MTSKTAANEQALDDLPETVYLVNEELKNNEVKFHIYVKGSTRNPGYASSSESFFKPRCGQDGRRQYDTDGLIEVPTTTLLDHLLPAMCRRCLHHMGLPQPETDVTGGEITVTDEGIHLSGGETTEKILDVSHPYRD